jgi:hypothetical protein
VWEVRTSQETHYLSTTENNWLILFGETVAVYYENRTEHTDTLCGQSVPHRKHITSPLESPNLVLFGKIVALYFENHIKHEAHYVGIMQSSTIIKEVVYIEATGIRRAKIRLPTLRETCARIDLSFRYFFLSWDSIPHEICPAISRQFILIICSALNTKFLFVNI